MDINDLIKYLPKSEIPQDFKDFDGNHFERCVECEKELYTGVEPYLIEKALKPGDVIFEYAICLSCASKINEKISKESREVLEQFFRRMQDPLEERMRNKLENPSDELGIERCLISGHATDSLHEYQIFGMFIGDKMVEGPYPYAMDSRVLDQLQEDLSDETKDILDDFGDRHFDWPPELKALMGPKPVLV
jgi:hypothetical protein